MDFHIKEKLWSGDKVYFETVGFRYDKDGNVHAGQLMFEPKRIIGVYSWDFKTPLVEGRDYTLDGRQFGWLPGSSIPVYPYDRNLPSYAEGEEPGFGVTWFDRSRHVSIDPKAYEYQIAVVYEHSGVWDGFVPPCERARLPKTFEKLAKGGDFSVVYFGDSIAAGWEASGLDEDVIGFRRNKESGQFEQCEFHLTIDREPHLPCWARLMSNSLQAAFPQANIIHTNRSAGGMSTHWALRTCDELVNPHKPDLFVLAFGMNQANRSVDEFIDHTRQLIGIVTEKNPDCEVLLMSTHEPNRDAEVYKEHVLLEQEKRLYALADELPGVNIAVSPIHSTFLELYKRGKVFGDLTGNNINHPNDFSTILYAMTLDATLGL